MLVLARLGVEELAARHRDELHAHPLQQRHRLLERLHLGAGADQHQLRRPVGHVVDMSWTPPAPQDSAGACRTAPTSPALASTSATASALARAAARSASASRDRVCCSSASNEAALSSAAAASDAPSAATCSAALPALASSS